MMKQLISILYLFSIVMACNKNYQENSLDELITPPNEVAFSNIYTLELADSLNIPLPKDIPTYPGLSDFMANDSTYYFSYENHKVAKVNTEHATIDSIVIPESSISGTIISVHSIDTDSLLLIQNKPASLILVNEDKKIEFFKLPKINFKTSNKRFNSISQSLTKDQTNFLLDYNNLYYDAKNQLVHIGIQPYDAFLVKGFENNARIGAFSLKDKGWKYTYAPPEGMMKYRGDKTYSYLMSKKNMLLKNDTMFVSYINDHNIYYYRNGNYLGKFFHVSSKSKKLFLPVDLEYAKDMEKMKKYTHAAPKYGAFYYHKKVKLYSRLYFDQQEPLDDQGKYRPMNLFRDVYAIFLDENFNHVGEYKFPKGSVEFVGAKPLTDGYLIYSTVHNDVDSLDIAFKLKYIYKIEPLSK